MTETLDQREPRYRALIAVLRRASSAQPKAIEPAHAGLVGMHVACGRHALSVGLYSSVNQHAPPSDALGQCAVAGRSMVRD